MFQECIQMTILVVKRKEKNKGGTTFWKKTEPGMNRLGWNLFILGVKTIFCLVLACFLLFLISSLFIDLFIFTGI